MDPTPNDHDLTARIHELEQTLDAVERRHAIDLALIDADAVDLESARLLTELAVTTMPDRDIASAITDLKKRKPFLFRARTTAPASPAGAMSTTPAPRAPTSHSDQSAARAGDRRALLNYLRARRGT